MDRRTEHVPRRWRRAASDLATRAFQVASGQGADGRHAVLPFIGGPLGGRLAPVMDTDGEVRLGTVEITGEYAWTSGMVTAVVRGGALVAGARARLIRAGRVIAEDLRVATLMHESPALEFVPRLGAGHQAECVLSLGCARAAAGDVAEAYIRLARGDHMDGDRFPVPGYGHDPLREETLGTAEIRDVIRGGGLTIARAARRSGELPRHARARVVRDGMVVGEALRVHYRARGERLDVARTPFSFTYRPITADPPEDGDLLVDLGFADLRPGDHIVAYAVPESPTEQRVGLARIIRAPSTTDPLAFEVLDGSVPARCRIRLLRDGVVRAEGGWFGAVVAEGPHQREFDRAVPGDLLEAYRRDGDERSGDGPEGSGEPRRPAAPRPRPAFDPELPEDVRALLAAHPDALEPAGRPPREPRRAWPLRGRGAKAQRLAHTAHGRYLRPDDLDERSRSLLLRAQNAVAAVQRSTVNGTGLLDDIRNAVTLPAQEWEIAQTLRTITELRAAQRSIAPERLTEPVRALLRDRRQALNTALASVTERVMALEAYADRTRVADAAYTEWLTLQELTARDDDYRELLARTVRDRLAGEQVEAMTAEAQRVQQTLAASVRAARQAGEGLLPRRPGQPGADGQVPQ